MTTSVKLLLGLALCLLVAMFGAATSIRQQFDSIDKSDKYARWQKKPLPPFHSVQIAGPSAAVVQIEPGKTTRLLADSVQTWKRATYAIRVERDTLFLDVNPVAGWPFDEYVNSEEWNDPQFVVQLPQLVSVSTRNAICQVQDFTGTVLTLQQRIRGNILVKHLTYNQLHASISGRNHLEIYGKRNRIGKGVITARDSSYFKQETNFLDGLTLSVDPSVKLELTGKALQQVQQ